MNLALVEKLRMAASVNGRRLTPQTSSRQSHGISETDIEMIWNDQKFATAQSFVDGFRKMEDEATEGSEKLVLQLALDLQHFLIGGIHFFDKNIAKLATVPLETFISSVRSVEGPIIREQKGTNQKGAIHVDSFIDIMSGFYIGLECLMSARDIAIRIKNDDSLLVKISSLISDHIFDPVLCNRLQGEIRGVLELFWNSEEFFKLFLAFGLTSLESLSARQLGMHKKNNPSAVSQRTFFDYMTKAMTKIGTEESFEKVVTHHLFGLSEGHDHFSLVLEDSSKLKIFKLLCNHVLKSTDFDVQFLWIEFIVTRLNAYVGGLLQTDAAKKAQTKSKNIRVFFINFYTSLMNRKTKFPLAQGVSLESFKMVDFTASFKIDGVFIPISAATMFTLEDRHASKKNKKSSAEQLFQVFLDQRRKHKPGASLCLHEWLKIKGSSHIDYGYLQLVLARQLNLAIETALKIFVIYSNKEENDLLRASMFEVFDDCYRCVGGMFFNQSSSQTYCQLLSHRSNDSFPEIRSIAFSICEKVLTDEMNNSGPNLRRFCMGLALARLRDSDEKVLLQAVQAINTAISKYVEVAPSSFEDKALNELIWLIGGSMSQDQDLKKQIDRLSFNLFFSDPKPREAQPTHQHPDSRRTKIEKRASVAIDENLAHRAVKTTERIKVLLLNRLTDQEAHKELSKLLDRAARSYMREAMPHEQIETVDKFVDITLVQNFKAEACYCLYGLLVHCDNTPKMMLQVKDVADPSLIKETLEMESDEDFIIRAKLISLVLSKFEVKTSEFHHLKISHLATFLEKFLDQFWNQSTERLKYLCKLVVAVSDFLDNQEILSTLLSKSISFIAAVRQGITTEASKQNIRKSTKIRSANDATIAPLKVAFFSIFHILQSVGFKLDPKVADHLAEMAVDFMKMKDAELFKHCLAVAYILMRRHSAKSKSKGASKVAQGQEIYELMDKHLADEKYTLKGTLFVSELILDAFKEGQGQPTYSRRSSKSSKMMSKKQSKNLGLDEGFTKLWRAHAQCLYDIIDRRDLSEPEDLLRTINIINEMALQKEIQVRSAFQSVFSLVLCPNYEIRTRARSVLKAISDFECRVFKEPIHYSIVKDLAESYAAGPFDRGQLIDLIWDFEVSNSLTYGEGYLSTYLQTQIIQTKTINVMSADLVYPKDILDIEAVVRGSRRLELCLFLTLFYSSKHNLARLAEVLRVFVRYIDEVAFTKNHFEGRAGVEFARKVFEASKLWALTMVCLEAMVAELSNPALGKSELPTSTFSQPVSQVLDIIISVCGKQKKTREVSLRFNSAMATLPVFDVADSNLMACLREELASSAVEEEREKLASLVTGAFSECVQSEETDWKNNRGNKKAGQEIKNKGGKHKKKGRGKRRRAMDDDSDEDAWSESSDDEDYYTTANNPARKKGFGSTVGSSRNLTSNQPNKPAHAHKSATSSNPSGTTGILTRAGKAALQRSLKGNTRRGSSARESSSSRR